MEEQVAIISLHKVFKHYEQRNRPLFILEDVSAQFAAGSLNVILGVSGSGKTTLLKLMCGLLRASSGDIYFHGRALSSSNFSELAAMRRKHFGFMFHEAGLLEHLTCRENIAFPLLKTSGERAQLLARQLGIEHCLDKFPHMMSLGEKQRAVMARALFEQPAVIIADEPTANLDWNNARKMVETLAGLTQQGVTVFVATHDERIAAYAHQVLHIEQGRLITNPTA